MLLITRTEYEHKRIIELENPYYNKLAAGFARFMGDTAARMLLEKIGGMTLKEFDSGQNYIALGELFALV